jgi:hypothetical protein
MYGTVGYAVQPEMMYMAIEKLKNLMPHMALNTRQHTGSSMELSERS